MRLRVRRSLPLPLVLLALSAAAPLPAQQLELSKNLQQFAPPSDSVLDAISARGRAVAAYQTASWQAFAALVSSKADLRAASSQIAYQTRDGWAVAYGSLDAARDTFYVSHVATQSKQSLADGDESAEAAYHVASLRVPSAEVGYLARAARAAETVRMPFVMAAGPVDRPHETVVLPAERGEWWVYVVPLAVRSGLWASGDDWRYRVSADGRRIVDVRRLHYGYMQYGADEPRKRPMVGPSLRTTILGEAPEDTDVAHVMMRTPHQPGYVSTPSYVYEIDATGRIRRIAEREALATR